MKAFISTGGAFAAGLLVFALLLSPVPAAGAAPGGQVQGVVVDALTNAYLPGAQVELAGTGWSAATATDGSFSLIDVAPGRYTLGVSYVGYAPQTYTVVVNAGSVANVAVRLTSEVVKLGTFVVQGAAAGQARALNEQAAATGSVDMVSADAIGNFPDQNAADALQRVSGVDTQRLYDEGTTVTIDGVAPDLNTVSVDGMTMMASSQTLDGRSVALNDFPASILASVTVVKDVTPDMDATAIGGEVELTTKSPFDFDAYPVITANASYQYNDLADKSGYIAGLVFIDRFGKDGEWGVAVSASREHRAGIEENVNVKTEGYTTFTGGGQSYYGYTPTEVELADEDFNDYRSAGSVALERKFGDTTHLYLRATRTDEILKNNRPSLDLIDGSSLDTSEPVAINPATGNFTEYTLNNDTAQRSILPRTLATDSTNITLGGDTQLDDWKIDYAGGYSLGFGETDVAAGAQFEPSGTQGMTWNLSNPTFPSFTQISGVALNNPSVYTFNQDKLKDDIQRNTAWIAKADAERPIDLGSESQLVLKAGFNLRWSDIGASDLFAQYTAGKTPVPMIASPYNGSLDSNPNLLGVYDLGPTTDPRGFQSWFLQNLNNTALFSYNLGKSLSSMYTNDYGLDEDVYAGYAMGTWKFRGLTAIAGVRYEGTEEDSDGYVQNTALATTDPARYTLEDYREPYGNVMPGVLLRYNLEKNLVLRASWTNTLARPDTDDIAPDQDVTYQTNPTVADPDVVTGGNPELKEETSTNWDAAVDYYFSAVGLVSARLFYKDIDRPVYESTYPGTYQGEPALFTVYNNAGQAWLRGWEFSYQQNFTFLPRPLDGLGVYANYTIVDSHVTVPGRAEFLPLFDQANKIGNLALTYQESRVFLRLAWSLTGSYLTTLNGPGIDTYEAPYRFLDFLGTFKLSKDWTLKATVSNIGNTPIREYFGNPTRMAYYGVDGRFSTIGIVWSY